MSEPSQPQLSEHGTVDVLQLRITLREDLTVSMQVYGDETSYLIEDPLNGRFFRVGLPEYTLLSLLDGSCTIAAAMGRTAELMGERAMTEPDAVAFCKWLVDSGLATTPQSRSGGRLSEASRQAGRQRLASRFNALFQRLPLLRPDELAGRLLPLARRAFSPLGAVVWCLLVLVGAASLAVRWDEFVRSSSSILSPHNWFFLAATWLALKLLHELAHALACKRYGGDVGEAGVMLVLLAPLPYVDVTSAWRFHSKWQRIAVSAAGMAAELLVAAVAACVWTYADPGLARQTAENVILTAGFMTVVFNANPLMRFDGYYILSDLLGMPNLATHAASWWRHWLRRLVLGGPPQRPNWPRRHTRAIAVYAVLAAAWRLLICVSLVIVAEAMFYGAGVVVAAVAAGTWLLAPAVRFAAEVLGTPDAAARRRVAAVACGVATAAVAAWTLIPWYTRVSAPAVVDYWPITEVRSGVEGFVERVAVRPGEKVRRGQLLVRLCNRELELEARRLRVEVRQSELRSRGFRSRRDLPALQVEDRNRSSLQQRLAEAEADLERLEIRASHDGRVVDLPLRDGQGTLVAPGDFLISLGADRNKRLYVMVPQEHLAAFKAQTLRPAETHIWGAGPLRSAAPVVQVGPRGSTHLLHPALGSHTGGPLEVRAKAGGEEGDQRWELTKPHFLAVAGGEAVHSAQPGQTGFVRFWRYDGTLGRVLLYRFARWLENRRNQAHRPWQDK